MKKVLHLKSKFNSEDSNVTSKEFFGAKHIVVEGVGSMICDTVMNGCLYTKDAVIDLANKTTDLVHAPASHPTDEDGNFILAGSPMAVHQNYVGAFAFNYRMQDDRLVHDLAINPEVAERSEDGREILKRIENKEDIDTSTGLLIYGFDDVEGYGNCGMMYNMVANEIELDHDAILLHEVGAATSRQGVGVFANSANNEKIKVEEFNVNSTIANTTFEISDGDYDESAAIKRIRKFTNSEEKPSSNYRRFFFYFDPKKPDDFSSYRYPFADIVNGKPVAFSEPVFRAKAMIEKSESLSEQEKKDAYDAADVYAKKYEKKNNSFIGNAWNSLKSFIFGSNEEAKEESLEDKMYKALNAETYKPTKQMADNAKRGLEMRDSQPDSNKGMTRVGLERANQLINRENLSLETVKRMYSFFSRHEVDKQSKSWKEGNSKAEQAWLGWGGDAGFAWSKRIVEAQEKKQNQELCPVEIKNNFVIYKSNSGTFYKKWYNVINDEILLSANQVEVSADVNISYNVKESDQMKDMILKALQEAGVEIEGMSDEKLLEAYMELKEGAKEAQEELDEANAKEDKEAEAEDNKEEKVDEANAEKEDLKAMVKQMISEAMSEMKEEKDNAEDKEDKDMKANASEDDEDELAAKVEGLGLGINKQAAKAMGINSMKNVLAANGVVAFNAKGGYNNTKVSAFDEMPD